MNERILSKYQEYYIPPAGCGNGCHGALLGKATLGVIAGLDPQQIFDDLKKATPAGRRHVSDKEILETVNRAIQDYANDATIQTPPKPKPAIDDGPKIRDKLIEQGRGVTEADIWEASPIRLNQAPDHDAALVTFYNTDDLIFAGNTYDGEGSIKRVSQWLKDFGNGITPGPHIIPNPLSRQRAPKKSGEGETYRGDNNVTSFLFAVVEFDNLPVEDQLAFWAAIDLPICALIDSGGKSVHAWLDVRALAEVSTLEGWNTQIRDRLYRELLIPLGVDAACANPSRLSRLPGHFRTEKGRFQRFLYLSSKGRKVFA
ncbi:MAG: hypothetical protein A4E57_03113 [Syntrophorhabdaceae bacterium PtaU1.Bin034]|nr:MAG: hypothetical protein A4E57_03113 [Syntrophorhabdaceae bacterium PtaU1.Bin034]